MNHSVITLPLSASEEDTLRLVAHGICPARHLRSDDIEQLSRLRLVEQDDGNVGLTGFGKIRLAQIKEEQLRSLIRAARARQIDGRAA